MWTQQSPDTLKATIFEEMDKLGASYLEAHYSGGNDEGGIDDVQLFVPAKPRQRKDVVMRTRDGKGFKFVPIALPEPGYLDYEHPLHDALSDLLSWDFGSFAGDFSCYGVVYVDVPTWRIWREGEISTYTSDDSAGEW